MYESVTLSHFSQSSVPLKLVKFVVFYWSPLKRNASMLGVRSQFMLLRHVCGIVCPLKYAIFNH